MGEGGRKSCLVIVAFLMGSFIALGTNLRITFGVELVSDGHASSFQTPVSSLPDVPPKEELPNNRLPDVPAKEETPKRALDLLEEENETELGSSSNRNHGPSHSPQEVADPETKLKWPMAKRLVDLQSSPKSKGMTEETATSATGTSLRKILKNPVKIIQIDTDFPSVEVILLRAIGNPLPPRHDAEQAYRNLEFTLKHEYEFPHLQKHWVLNRLVDDQLLRRLCGLLDQYDQTYTIIPFNLTEYEQVQYRFDYHRPVKDPVHDMSYIKQTMKGHYQIDEAINQDKNLYVTNQNAARNVMLDLGQKSGKDWILPWDGNCFLHPLAYQDLYKDLQSLPSTDKYSITPMNRAMSNNEVLEEEYRPKPIEEPQVAFHKTAKGRFHPKLRYGRRNKVEFIQRLKVKGPWDRWSPYLRWENQHLGPFFEPLQDLPPHGTKSTGWVTRLSSGKTHLEVKGVIHARGQSRLESMIKFLGQLDVRAAVELHGYVPGKDLIFYHEAALERDRKLYRDGDKRIMPLMNSLLKLAKSALSVGPWSVTHKPDHSVAISRDKRDYYHLSPYYWPKDKRLANDPSHRWIRRDGRRYPGTELHGEGSDHFDRTRLKDMKYNTTVLGLAYYMTGESRYGEVAARNIRTWFLDPESRMNPHMKFAQVRKGYNNNTGASFGIIEMKDLYYLLDIVRLVERGGFLNEAEQTDLREWFREYLEWLETSSIGMEEYTSNNNHGLYYDIQLSSIASFINDTAKMIWYIERSRSRMSAQIAQDGRLPEELRRPTCEHYQMFTLQGWSILSRLAQPVNRNLWMLPDHQLCRAAKYAIPFYGRRRKCNNSQKPEVVDVERWWPLLHESLAYCRNLEADVWPAWFEKDAQVPPQNVYDMPAIVDAHSGIAPFWQLGLRSAGNSKPHAITRHVRREVSLSLST
jgi:hypothetical protein